MMKKVFFASLIALFSQVGFANIIIDVSVKLSKIVPNNYELVCSSSGCTYPWVDWQTKWISVTSPAGDYMPITFVMVTLSGQKHLWIREANSANEIDGVCLALPYRPCGQGSEYELGYARLRRDIDGQDAGKVYFTLNESGYLVVSLDGVLLSQNYSLLRLLPLPQDPGGGGQAMQSSSSSAGTFPQTGEFLDDRNSKEPTFATTISPNPFTQQINVKVESSLEGKVMLQLFSSDGKSFQVPILANNETEFVVLTHEIPPGFYFLRVQTGSQNTLHRLVKLE